MEVGRHLRCLRVPSSVKPVTGPPAVILSDAKNPQPGIRSTHADAAVPRAGGCTLIERFAPDHDGITNGMHAE